MNAEMIHLLWLDGFGLAWIRLSITLARVNQQLVKSIHYENSHILHSTVKLRQNRKQHWNDINIVFEYFITCNKKQRTRSAPRARLQKARRKAECDRNSFIRFISHNIHTRPENDFIKMVRPKQQSTKSIITHKTHTQNTHIQAEKERERTNHKTNKTRNHVLFLILIPHIQLCGKQKLEEQANERFEQTLKYANHTHILYYRDRIIWPNLSSKTQDINKVAKKKPLEWPEGEINIWAWLQFHE